MVFKFLLFTFSPLRINLPRFPSRWGGGKFLWQISWSNWPSRFCALDKCCLSNSPRELCHKFSGRRRWPQPLETPNGLTVCQIDDSPLLLKLASIAVEVGCKILVANLLGWLALRFHARYICGESPGQFGLGDFVPDLNPQPRFLAALSSLPGRLFWPLVYTTSHAYA